MSDWAQLISTIGFPIVAFLICVYGLKYAYDKSREDNSKSMEQISKLADAINNNSLVLTELVTKIEERDNDK